MKFVIPVKLMCMEDKKETWTPIKSETIIVEIGVPTPSQKQWETNRLWWEACRKKWDEVKDKPNADELHNQWIRDNTP